MDDRRFDDLSRRLATGVSRRQVLKTLAGGVLGGVAGALGLTRVAAGCTTDRDCPPGERCDPAAATCIPRGGGPAVNQMQSQTVGIAATCIDDTGCAANETCVDGTCTASGGPCPRGSGCTTDATCCGGEICDTLNQTCVGAGGPCTNTTGMCLDSTECCGNEECVGGVCQLAVGGCAPGAICAADAECCGGQVCANGTCAQAARPAGCPEGQVRCSGTCVDITTDPNNCGACGAVCAPGLTCVGGVCTGSIPCYADADCPDCMACYRRGGGQGTCFACEAIHGPCMPCGANGRCEELCPGCDECSQDEMGNASCRGECPPCYACNTTLGICEPACDASACQYCQIDESGAATCLSVCGSCSDCIDGACVFRCNVANCETCALDATGNEICVSTCTEGQQCTAISTDPPLYACG